MALFGRDYDRNFGHRGGLGNRGYDRGHRSGWNPYDRDVSSFGGVRYEPSMERNRYDREFGGSEYDRGYKSRWQTNHGDPFGDRAAHTPMRVIRGEYRSDYDRGYRGGDRQDFRSNRGNPYDRNFHEGGSAGYDPYSSREGTRMRGGGRNNRTYGRGYDTGWF